VPLPRCGKAEYLKILTHNTTAATSSRALIVAELSILLRHELPSP
jgi:hypothetical protein